VSTFDYEQTTWLKCKVSFVIQNKITPFVLCQGLNPIQLSPFSLYPGWHNWQV